LNNSLVNFYKIFYGPKFVRIFRRPHKFKNNPKFRIEFNTYNPKNLFLHVKRNSGFHKCLISIYSYGVKNQLDKRKFHENVIIDRIFFDFDMQLPLGLKELKNELIKLRAYGVNHEKTRQNKIKEHLQKAKSMVSSFKIFFIVDANSNIILLGLDSCTGLKKV